MMNGRMSWLFSSPLPVGAPAPDFSLPEESGRMVTLSALRGSGVVLVFYPGDDTPAVSYTHLDVYKRQSPESPFRERPE